MTAFDFFTILVAIPVGLALVEIAQGISITLRRREEISIGWFTPLTAFLLIVTSASLWLMLWSFRDSVEMSAPHLVTGLLIATIYYVAASFIFPNHLERGVDLDAWFMKYRAYSLGGTFVIIMALRFFQGTAMPSLDTDRGISSTIAYLMAWSTRPALILVAIFAKRRAIILTALVALILILILAMVL